MTEERKPSADQRIVEAFGLLLHARVRAEQDVVFATTLGWIRVAEIWIERAIDAYHDAYSVEALQDDRVRRTRLQDCAKKLRHARGAAVGASLPLCSRDHASVIYKLWDAITLADNKLDEVAAEADQMAEVL